MDSIPRRGELKIFACRSALKFGQRVCEELTNLHKSLGIDKEISLGKSSIKIFADSDFVVELEENVRGKDVYIIQTGTKDDKLGFSMHDNKEELIYFIDAAKRDGKAANVVAVIPLYFSSSLQLLYHLLNLSKLLQIPLCSLFSSKFF